jgi:tetratricopeptide (TPR) repeat protein
MLKGVLKDIFRAVAPRKRPSTQASPLEDLDRWRAEFQGASPDRRQELKAALTRWIGQHASLKQGWTLRADWALSSKDLVAAEADYREALRLDPLSPAAQEGLGLTLLYAGRLDEAYLHLEHAHRSQPMNSEVLTHWGLVSLEQGNLADAESKFNKAVERGPRNPHAWHNLGLVFLKSGRPQASLQYLLKAVELKPDHGLAYSNLALAYRDAEDLPHALEAARQAVKLKPGNARVWVILADLLTDFGSLDEAENALRQADALDPSDVGAQIARAKWALARADHPVARAAFGRALALEPGNPEAEAGLGQLELLIGNFGRGWDLYEARRRTATRPVRSFGLPEWSGQPLAGKTLLVYAEQGLGDNMLFASCLPELVRMASRVIIETPVALASLFQRSFPDATVVGRDTSDSQRGWLQELPSVDFELPIGSLPKWLRREPSQFPSRAGYLKADPARVAHWKGVLAASGPGPYLGLAWRGGMARSAGRQRSLPLEQLLEAFNGLQGQLISLQYGDVETALRRAEIDAGRQVRRFHEALHDQDEAAALTMALDGVVTVCQTQAHLTGALGQRGWVMVPANPNWRYGAAGDAMPWYPSLRLIRQDFIGNWDASLVGIAAQISQIVRLYQQA